MSDWLETEIKLGLPDEAAWEWVRSQLRAPGVHHQANHFFDDRERRFGAGRIGVRLRSQAGSWTLAVKTDPSDQTGPVSHRLELEEPLEASDARRAISTTLDLAPFVEAWRARFATAEARDLDVFLNRIESLASKPLSCFGGFDNERTVGLLDLPVLASPIHVELDRTRYSSARTDYELEVELKASEESISRTQTALVSWLEDEGGIRTFSVPSKLARFEALRASD